jgi:hypothetical protein
MLGKLIPIILALVGLGGGIGAGIALRPDPAEVGMLENPCGDYAAMPDKEKMAEEEESEEPDASSFDYVKLNNQFVVPVVADSRVISLVVMSLTLQVESGQNESVYTVEPKLRDALLQVMFDHANAGGFNGPFTEAARMRILRKALLEAAQSTVGDVVSDVLIIDVVRQDAA